MSRAKARERTRKAGERSAASDGAPADPVPHVGSLAALNDALTATDESDERK